MMKLCMMMGAYLIIMMGLWSFGKLRFHMVSTLLSLEFASVSLYLILFLMLSAFPSDLFMSLVYLTLAACEGALGLSILVVIIKYSGNDYSKINNIPQC